MERTLILCGEYFFVSRYGGNPEGIHVKMRVDEGNWYISFMKTGALRCSFMFYDSLDGRLISYNWFSRWASLAETYATLPVYAHQAAP